MFSICFPSISVERFVKKTVSGLLLCLQFRFNLPCGSISPRISQSKISSLQKIPLNVLFCASVGWQIYLLTIHFHMRRTKKQQVTFFFKMLLPGFSHLLSAFIVAVFIYPAYNKQHKEVKLLIALFAPLIVVIVKTISRISVQRLRNITHPGYSYALLTPLYFGSAVVFRVLQADLGSIQSIAILGIIHGATEVIERSTMVVIDRICHVIWKRKSAPWGSFRTPRRERLTPPLLRPR